MHLPPLPDLGIYSICTHLIPLRVSCNEWIRGPVHRRPLLNNCQIELFICGSLFSTQLRLYTCVLSWINLCHTSTFLSFFNFFFFGYTSGPSGILVPWTGIEPMPSAVEIQSPNHWITRELPRPSHAPHPTPPPPTLPLFRSRKGINMSSSPTPGCFSIQRD